MHSLPLVVFSKGLQLQTEVVRVEFYYFAILVTTFWETEVVYTGIFELLWAMKFFGFDRKNG